jgi:chromosome segregation ATPase
VFGEGTTGGTVSSNLHVGIEAIDEGAGSLAPAWPRERRLRRPWLAIGIVSALIAAIAGLALYDVHDANRTVTAELARTNARLADARTQAANVTAQRAAADATLTATIARLDHANDQRHSVEILYRAIRTNLKTQQGKLHQTTHDLKTSAKQLDYLNWCLAGVTNAMTQASYDAESQAIATLHSVAAACELAKSLAGTSP